MTRLYDILRNKATSEETQDSQTKKDDNASASKEDANPPLSFSRAIIKIETKKSKKNNEFSLVSKKLISEVKKYGVDNQEKSKEIYVAGLGTIRFLLGKVAAGEELLPYLDKIYSLLDDIFNQLVLGDSILDNIYENRQGEYYLPYHIVNTLTLSTLLALNMGFNKSRLSHLGLAIVFYDLEMESYREITSLPRELVEEEHALIRAHIPKGLKLLEKISGISEVVKETIQQHHERINGKGYPTGMKSSDINPYAKIIGLVDTYEAITNARPHRQAMNAHQAVRFLLGPLKDYFDADVMKVFINRMSVYPIGSMIRLDTQELARVINVHPGFPLRPVVMIIQDASGKPAKERRIIDLSKEESLFIKESI